MSDDEKNKILEKLKSTYSELGGGKVLVSQLVHKAGGKKEDKQKILALFDVDGYDDILQMIPGESPSKEVAPAQGAAPEVPVQERVRRVLAALNAHLYGKEEAVRLALLSAVAGESVFFLGPPGTAKSMISRRLAAAFKDLDRERDYFEYLMNEFSTPDEICGPVSLKKLNEDEYTRLTEGYLPSARVAFLDEIWKSGPAILNTLLTIVNERKFHNGRVAQKVPLVSLAGASNELPERGRGLEALWDRFILRVMVEPVASEEDFFRVVDSPAQEEPELDPQHQLAFGEVEAWQEDIDAVELGDEARKVISAVRKELARRNQALDGKERDEESWYVSDRRWKKIVRILKASAFLNGRAAVDLMDCSLIACCIWSTDRQRREVDAILEEILAEYGMDCTTTIEELREELEELDTPEQFDSLEQEIEGEIASLHEFKAGNEAPFAENAFADQRYCPVLLRKVEEGIRELEDLRLELQKRRDGHKGKASLPAPNKGSGQAAAGPAIGDKGPGGGLVFHIDGTTAYEVSGVLGSAGGMRPRGWRRATVAGDSAPGGFPAGRSWT